MEGRLLASVKVWKLKQISSSVCGTGDVSSSIVDVLYQRHIDIIVHIAREKKTQRNDQDMACCYIVSS